jgi:hypothetical protein
MKTLRFLMMVLGSLVFLLFHLNNESAFAQQDVGNVDGVTVRNESASNQYLFPVSIKNKIGFIDSLGHQVIPPIYESTQEFSSELCAVRLNGVYGFINPMGKMVIEPQFDFATRFTEGLALVYRGSRPLFIDQHGKELITPHFANMSSFHQGYAYVVTASKKYGIINKAGRLTVDTVYEWIGEFTDGRAVAQGVGHEESNSKEKKRSLRLTIIDTAGNMLVPFGKFEAIRDVGEGYYVVRQDKRDRQLIINHRGEVQYVIKKGENDEYDATMSNGTFRLYRYRKNGDVNSGTYNIYITPQGKTIYVNEKTDVAQDFSENLAFWSDEARNYHLINRIGKIVGDYNDAKPFKNGMALVNKNGNWGVIDTTGNFILPPKFHEVHDNGITSGFIFFQDSTFEYTDEVPYPKYGMADIRGNIIIPPSFQFFELRGFSHGTLKTWIDNAVVFYNDRGDVVWQQEGSISKTLHTRNIDFMQRGYFHAFGEDTGHGGEYGAKPKELSQMHSFKQSALTLTVRPEEETVIEQELKGIKVFIANTTSDTLVFNTQDNRLYMKMQARDTTGKWRDIEYLPHSWCGNSYYATILPNNHYWELSALMYEGSFKTKLRLELTYVDPTDTVGLAAERTNRKRFSSRYQHRKETTIYSNEFDGSVNPGQFWRKPEYNPAGLMDPYNE